MDPQVKLEDDRKSVSSKQKFMLIFRIIFYFFYSRYLIYTHAYKREKYEDRDTLERVIFPHILAHHNPKHILDIGREDYQEFYNEFFIGKDLWTLDKEEEHAQFGARQHIIDNVGNLKDHFKDNYFDFILMNGVFGWGLNNKDLIEKTFDAIYQILNKNGVFILGWNDVEDLTPVPLDQIQALKKFKPFYFKPLKGTSFKAKNGEHTYNFYIKE